MSYDIHYSAPAESDAETIGVYYEKISPGLGLRFFSDIDKLIAAKVYPTSLWG